MLALVTECFGGRGGIAQYNRDLMRALTRSGIFSSITILPRNAPDRAAPAPGEVEQLPACHGRFTYAITALKAAAARPVGIVFCGHLYMAPLAALIAKLKGAKLIIQMHGIEAWAKPTRAQRTAVEAADRVLCVSRYTRACVLGWASIAPERVLVLPNTVEADFTPGDSPLRAAWGLEGKRVLLTVGRLDARERYKGHDRVIAAIPDLVKRGLDVIYAIVGEGDDCGRLKALARERGVADRVRFVGAVDRNTLVDAYRAADLFVMPSTGEGFGIAFLEAMASGTRALGLSVAGARDALVDGELGTAVAEDELTTAIVELLAAPKPDAVALAQSVRGRFGQEKFVKCAGELLRPIASA
jgi:phosphatidylinositol alpha-1,6-mannosyltransferase